MPVLSHVPQIRRPLTAVLLGAALLVPVAPALPASAAPSAPATSS